LGALGRAPRLAQRRVIFFLLADARFVGEPDFYGAELDVRLAPDRFQARGNALRSLIAPAA
jgi:hypothetical protein